MRTLYEYTAPESEGGAKVRLLERRAWSRSSFAVVLDVPGAVASFDTFHDIEYAAGAFATLCERFGGITQAEQVVFLP